MLDFCKTPVQSDSTVEFSLTRTTKNYPHQNLPEGNSILHTWNLATRLNSQN